MKSAKAGSSTEGMVPTEEETLATTTGSSAGADFILLLRTAREITPLYIPKIRRATIRHERRRNSVRISERFNLAQLETSDVPSPVHQL